MCVYVRIHVYLAGGYSGVYIVVCIDRDVIGRVPYSHVGIGI